MSNKKILLRMLFIAAIIMLGGHLAFAQSIVLTETEIKEDPESVKILYATNRTVPVECYDLATPPQIVVDFMGDVYTNAKEAQVVNKGVIKQMRFIKGTKTSPDLDESYYPVDFIIIDLKEAARYDFDQGLTTSVLMVSNTGKKPPKAQAVKEEAAQMPKTKPAAMPVQAETAQTSAMEMAEPEYEQPMTAEEEIAPEQEQAIAAAKKAPKVKAKAEKPQEKTFTKKVTGGIKNFFTFGKPKTPEQIQAQKEREAAREAKIERARQAKEAARKKRELRAKKKAEARRKSSRAKKTRVKKPKKQKMMADPTEKVEQAKQKVAKAEADVSAAKEQLNAAQENIKNAEKDQASLDERIGLSKAKAELAKDAYETSLKHMKLAKSAANSIWLEYSNAKSKLASYLENGVEQKMVDAAQKAYDEKKTELEKAIKAAEDTKKESDNKLAEYNSLNQENEALIAQSQDPAGGVAKAQQDYELKKNDLGKKQAELEAAQKELADAELELKQYELEKADEEYKKSLEVIDAQLVKEMELEQQRMEEERMAAEQERLRKLEEEQMAEQARQLEDEKQAEKEKEEAQLAALAALEADQKRKAQEESKRMTTRRAERPKMRKVTLPEKKVEKEAVALRGDTLESAVELRNAGLEMQRNGDLDSAVKYYQQALMQDPNYATVHNDLGILYEQKGLTDKAKMEYLTTLKIDPQYIKAHSNLALLYEKSGDYKKAYYHWKQRVNLGREDDPWTLKAKQRMEMLENRK